MAFFATGLGFLVLALFCWALVLIHAFRRSLGTGFMVLCLPLYYLYYAFSQFEHRQKGLIIAGSIGGMVVGLVFGRLASLAG